MKIKTYELKRAELLIPAIDDPENDSLVFFSDEAVFHLSRVVNKHNCRIWAEENPHNTIEVPNYSPKVTVWCAKSSEQIIGPWFFNESSINQANYLDMLENYLYPILRRKRLVKKIVFQQDGAPAQFSRQVRAWLNEKFDDRWIGHGGPISWAPRSSDLTPLDFFFGVISNRTSTRQRCRISKC